MKIQLKCRTGCGGYGDIVTVGKEVSKSEAKTLLADGHAVKVDERVLMSDKELKARIDELEKANAELSRRIRELEAEKAALSEDLDSLSDEELKDRYREVVGANPGSRKRETLISELKGVSNGS
jgi:predicted nuclease with TOPRIM domain